MKLLKLIIFWYRPEEYHFARYTIVLIEKRHRIYILENFRFRERMRKIKTEVSFWKFSINQCPEIFRQKEKYFSSVFFLFPAGEFPNGYGGRDVNVQTSNYATLGDFDNTVQMGNQPKWDPFFFISQNQNTFFGKRKLNFWFRESLNFLSFENYLLYHNTVGSLF